MALRFGLFKTPKHKVFNYKPLYWDPEKEELNERIKRAQAEAGIIEASDNPKSTHTRNMIRGSFQKAMYENRRYAGNQKFIRVIIILSFAIVLVALFYFTKIMEVIFSIFYN